MESIIIFMMKKCYYYIEGEREREYTEKNVM